MSKKVPVAATVQLDVVMDLIESVPLVNLEEIITTKIVNALTESGIIVVMIGGKLDVRNIIVHPERKPFEC